MNPITPEEKTELVAEILRAEGFSQRADKSTAVLKFLLERHLAAPDKPPTRSEIFNVVWKDEFHTNPGATVGSAMGRLRVALEDYFRGPGGIQLLRLGIPTGGHSLVFTSTLDEAEDVIDWFWGTYFKETDARLGIIQPLLKYMTDCAQETEFSKRLWTREERQVGFIYPILRSVQQFERFFGKRDRSIDLFAADWKENELENLNSYNSVLLDTTLVVPESRSTYFVRVLRSPMDFKNSLSTAETRRGLQYLRATSPMTMYRDPSGNPSISVREIEGEDPRHFNDSNSRCNVLLTRATLPSTSRTVTVLAADSFNSILPVAAYVTNPKGLRAISSTPNFVEATKQWRTAAEGGKEELGPRYERGAPPDFQIVFSTPRNYSSDTSTEHVLQSVQIEDIAFLGYPGRRGTFYDGRKGAEPRK